MIKLIDLDFRQTQYDRPTMRKVCGLARYGHGCELGPTVEGECPRRAQCIPFRNEDRWECTRTRASGGKCASGPTPDGRCTHYVQCIPENNIRFLRSRLVVFSLIGLFAVIIIALASPLSNDVVSPGPLSNVHAGIGEAECEGCHQVGFQSAGNVLAAAFAEDSIHDGNRACLSCHQMGAQADLAHGVPSSTLGAERTQEIACSVCHKEHKGTDADLTSISNQRCDSCHQESHDPFRTAHPQFDNYVPNPIAMIRFDHEKHVGKYFLEEENVNVAPSNCRSCHQVANQSGSMGVKPFQQICSDCHDKDVRSLTSRDKGIPVINIPSMDIETLQERGLDIGNWPEDADGGYLTPMFAALLAQNEDLAPLIQRINNGDVDLTDLRDATPDDMIRVVELAWTIKTFLYELETKGHAYMIDKISKLPAQSEGMEGQLLASLPLDLLADASEHWFGDLGTQIDTFRSGGVVETKAREVDPSALASKRIDQMELGGWFVTPVGIAYRPTGHADNFMTAWLAISNLLRRQSTYPEFETVYGMLSSRGIPGACGKCHSVSSELSPDTHWESIQLPDTDFTNFDHRVHFLIVGEQGCLTCHQTGDDGGFASISKDTCQSCHVTNGAGDSCVTCHDYHLDGFETVLPNTRVEELANRPE